jgi:hypothetical protein
MDIIEGPLIVETLQEPQQQGSQPLTSPAPAQAKMPELDDAAVRQAIASAEANGLRPETLTLADLSQGQAQTPQTVAQAQAAQPQTEVPAKFLKPNGEVDVEKIQTSTRQLDQAIEAKQTGIQEVQKTVDDYLREYREKEAKFRGLPNPQRLAAELPPQQPPPPPITPAQMSDQQLRDILQRDYQVDPVGTTAQLIEIAIQKRLEPIEHERENGRIRGNIESLAKNDPRVLQPEVFAAINAKLDQDPDLWKLKNPHKAAWLEVKDALRLGDAPVMAHQAQPSRSASPILGGGTPPSSPSASGMSNPQKIVASLDQLDVRDRKQEAAGDEAIRALLARERA